MGNFSDHAGVWDCTYKPSETDSLHYIHALCDPQYKNLVTSQILRWTSRYECWASLDSSIISSSRSFTCLLTRI